MRLLLCLLFLPIVAHAPATPRGMNADAWGWTPPLTGAQLVRWNAAVYGEANEGTTPHAEAIPALVATGAEPVVVLWHECRAYSEADLQDAAAWAGELAARYPAVRYWQVGNEPDTGGPHGWNHGWCDTPQAYARLVALSYEAIKAAQPEDTVLLGGIAEDMDYLQAVVDAGARFDVAAVHHYGRWYGSAPDPAAVWQQVEAAQVIAGKPVWLTETALLCRAGCPAPTPDQFWRLDEADKAHPFYTAQADWLRAVYAEGARREVVVFWYSWFHWWGDAGLWFGDGSPKPAHAAWASLKNGGGGLPPTYLPPTNENETRTIRE